MQFAAPCALYTVFWPQCLLLTHALPLDGHDVKRILSVRCCEADVAFWMVVLRCNDTVPVVPLDERVDDGNDVLPVWDR